MVAPVTFATLAPPNQNLNLFDTMFAWLAQYAVTVCSATGTNVIALTPDPNGPAFSTVINGQALSFTAANSSTGPVTLSVAGVTGTFKVFINNTTQANAGDILAGVKYMVFWDPTLNSSAGGWQIGGPGLGTPWDIYTPVITTGTGTITTSSAVGEFLKLGKMVALQGSILVTTNGTGATSLIASLPFAATASYPQVLTAINGTDGLSNIGLIAAAGTTVTITKYDGTYPTASGKTTVFGGVYQSA